MIAELFFAEYEYSLEGCDTAYHAHAAILAEAEIPSSYAPVFVYKGHSPNLWPIACVGFVNEDIARQYTAVYLGVEPYDEEVTTYLSESSMAPGRVWQDHED